MGNILIICEQSSGEIKKYSRELAYKAFDVALKLGVKVTALLFGPEAMEDAATLGSCGVSDVKIIEGEGLADFNSDQFVAAATKVINDLKPSYVFATASVIGRDILPRLAVKFNAGMATECTDLSIEGSDVVFRRPIYAGKVLADVKIKSEIKFATMRPNVFDIGDAKNKIAAIESINVEPTDSKIVLKGKKQADVSQVDLVEANVVVSGGRAMGNAENYKVLRELADLLNASIGASRAAVDAGYISHDHQVGQTGKTVNPTLYIACGISGAIQHIAGMKTSKIIVAINKDPEAPIFTKADFGIVGDLFKVVPEVVKKLKSKE